MTERFDHWVGGAWRTPAAGAYWDGATSPLDGEVFALFARGDAADVDVAVAAAQEAQHRWADLAPAARGRVLTAIAAAIRDNIDELARLEQGQTGKPNARREIDAAAEYFSYYGAVIRAAHGETVETGSGQTSYVKHYPYGVIAIITPWNGPLNQASRDVAPALATGNAVVLKPSEFTSASSLLLAKLAFEAGLPAGLLNVVTGLGTEVGAALVDHPGIRKVAFTGSVATGSRIGAAAAGRAVPCTLELGGKSANIVFADANLDRAAQHVAMGFTANAGQICSTPTRLVVEHTIHDELVDRVADIVKSLQFGKQVGPMITAAQFDKVQTYFAIALDEKATVRLGGHVATEPPFDRGRYIHPTIYTDVRPDMRIAQEEIFGPVLSVLSFDTEDEAIRIANGTAYGLAGSVWTSDLGRGLRVADRIEAGQVTVNGAFHGVESPFGGFKESGTGRVKGLAALHTYTQTKTIGLSTVS